MIVYTIAFVFLSILTPFLWVSYVWDQTIDPHYDYDNAVQEPELWFLNKLYHGSRRINSSLALRTTVFILVSILIILSAVLDVVRMSQHFF